MRWISLLCLSLVAGLLPSNPVWAQATGQVTGVVTSEAGAPISDAAVSIVGTARGARTGADGRYTITGVPAGTREVRASRLGYEEQVRQVMVAAGQTATADFQLSSQAVMLEGIVAVGYGTQEARNVTGAVSSVRAENIEDLPVAGPDQAIAGQVAGVQVQQATGIPGGGAQIQIRGVGAIGAGTQPLYVVDGFPLPSGGGQVLNPLNDIRPEDIESISILKDASSAAIYGSRAANGVVLITTKSGRNQTPRVEVSASSGFQQVPGWGVQDMMSGQEFARFQKERIEDDFRWRNGRAMSPEEAAELIPATYQNPDAVQGVDWFDEITRVAPVHDVSISAAGGSGNLSAYVSAGYLRQEGVIESTDYDRYSLRANVRADVSDRFNVGLNVAPVYSRRNLSVAGGVGRSEAGLGAALVTSPVATLRNSDGSLVPMIGSPGTFLHPNPLLALQEIEDETTDFRTIGTGFAELEVLDGLKLRTSLNADWFRRGTDFFRPSTVGQVFAPPPLTPVGTYGTSTYLNWLNENTLNYTGTLAGDHNVDLLVGTSVQVNNEESSFFVGQDFPDDDIRTFNAAARITGGTGAEDWGLVSYLARLNYDYAGKYFLSAAVRTDGSSRFGPENRWGTFPSVALAWRVSEEPLLRDAGWISDLKLRFSYGVTGNNQIGNFDYVGRVGPGNYVFDGSLAAGRGLYTLGNAFLGWERTRETNLGVDLSMFDNRVALTAELYQSYTDDLLLNTEIPPSSGFTNVTENRGELRNRGVELGLQTINVERGRFQWTSDINVAVNRNTVMALSRNGAPILSGLSGERHPTHITMVGKPLGMFYGYEFLGLYQDSADVANSPSFPGAIPGNMKVADINGDGVITPVADFTIIGNPNPDATFGITNNLSFGSFDLRVLATGQIGGDLMHGFYEAVHNIDGVFNVTRDIANRWRSPEQPGSGRVPTTAGSALGRVMYRDVSSLWVEDATHLNIRNVTLRYALPERLVGRISDGASVYASVQNAFIFTGYDGYPEVTNYRGRAGATTLAPGWDYSPYPPARTLTIGTQFTF